MPSDVQNVAQNWSKQLNMNSIFIFDLMGIKLYSDLNSAKRFPKTWPLARGP
jgi:hypothetical protein